MLSKKTPIFGQSRIKDLTKIAHPAPKCYRTFLRSKLSQLHLGAGLRIFVKSLMRPCLNYGRFYKFQSIYFFILLGFCFSTFCCFADEPSIGDKLFTATDALTRLMLIACFVVGVGFIFLSFIQFKTHRQNPKLMPLDKPIWYLVLGIILIGIIFLEQIFGGGTGNILYLKKNEAEHTQQSYPYNIDAPIEQKNPSTSTQTNKNKK